MTGGAVLVLCPVSVKAGWEHEAEIVGVVISVHSWGCVPAPPPTRPAVVGPHHSGYFVIADEAVRAASRPAGCGVGVDEGVYAGGSLHLLFRSPLAGATSLTQRRLCMIRVPCQLT